MLLVCCTHLPVRRLSNEVTKPERMLANAIANPLRKKGAVDTATASVSRERLDIMRAALERVVKACRGPGGLQKMTDSHLGCLISAIQVGLNLKYLLFDLQRT